MPKRHTSLRLHTLSFVLAALAAVGLTLHCGGGGGSEQPQNDGGNDDTATDGVTNETKGDSTTTDGDVAPTDSKPGDTGTDATTPVKCTVAPTFGPLDATKKFTPLRLNHNPDALR